MLHIEALNMHLPNVVLEHGSFVDTELQPSTKSPIGHLARDFNGAPMRALHSSHRGQATFLDAVRRNDRPTSRSGPGKDLQHSE